MKNVTAFSLCLLLLLTACQKEADLGDPAGGIGSGGSGGTTSGTRLIRIGTRTGADTITTSFAYNAAGSISNIAYDGSLSGQLIDAQVRLVRNAAGVIMSYIAKSSIYATIGLDSLVTNYVYDAMAGRYKYGLAKYNAFGTNGSDSAVFSYDASGKLVSGITYHNDGSGYAPDTKTDYTYSGNNIATQKTYSYNGTAFDLDELDSYDQYDAKTNPLQFQKDAPIIGLTTFYSANNPTKRTVTDYSSGSPVVSAGTFTYTYNNQNQPLKASGTDGSQSSTSTYTYQ